MFYISHTLDLMTHSAYCLTCPWRTVLQAWRWFYTH